MERLKVAARNPALYTTLGRVGEAGNFRFLFLIFIRYNSGVIV